MQYNSLQHVATRHYTLQHAATPAAVASWNIYQQPQVTPPLAPPLALEG